MQRRDQFVAVLPDGDDPDRDVGGTRPRRRGGASRRRPRCRGEDVADVAGVAMVEQPLVVRRDLRLGQDAIGPGHGDVDLLVAAEAHRHAGDDAGRRTTAASAAA